MNEGTFRHVSQFHGIADLDICCFAGDNLGTDCELLRSDDVALLTIFVIDQSNVGIAVRIVFDCSNRSFDIVLVSLEVDDSVLLLDASTLMTSCDAAGVSASALALLRSQQALFRSGLGNVSGGRCS